MVLIYVLINLIWFIALFLFSFSTAILLYVQGCTHAEQSSLGRTFCYICICFWGFQCLSQDCFTYSGGTDPLGKLLCTGIPASDAHIHALTKLFLAYLASILCFTMVFCQVGNSDYVTIKYISLKVKGDPLFIAYLSISLVLIKIVFLSYLTCSVGGYIQSGQRNNTSVFTLASEEKI